MQRGYKTEALKNKNGKFCGFSLGSGACAEHEWGIDGIKRAFNISSDKGIFGINRRRARTFPSSEYFNLLKEKKHWTLVYSRYSGWNNSQELESYSFRGSPSKEQLYSAWSGEDFAIRVYSDAPNSKENQKNLELLYDAFITGDAAIWLGGGGVFESAGLVLAIISECLEDGLQEMHRSDEESLRLHLEYQEIEKKLNLEKRLKDANCKYFALSPRFHYGKKDDITVFPIWFWLNTYDQYNNRSGWVTVEDILAWTKGKGPIPEDGTRRVNGPYAGSIHEHVQKGVFGKE